MLNGLRDWLRAIDRGVAADVALVFFVAFGVRLFWAALTPPWLAPDEPSHFSYVTHLVENGEVPDQSALDMRYPEFSREYQESCDLTLCTTISGFGHGFGPRQLLPLEHDYARARALRFHGDLRKNQAGSSASAYPAFYYAIASLPYRALYNEPILTRLLGVRAVSGWLSALACAFGYLFAFEITRSRLWGRSVGLSLAFMPMHAFIGSAVNNDAAMFAGTSALWWLLARMWFANQVRLASAFVLGAVAGVSILGKPTAAPLVVPAALLVVAKAIRPNKRWELQPRAAAPIACFAAGLLLTQVFRYLYRSTRVAAATVTTATGAGAGKSDVVKALLGEANYSLGDYLQHLYSRGWTYFNWLFVKTFWGNFGWLEVFLSDTTYATIGVLLVACAGGLAVRLWIRPAERKTIAVLLAAVAFNCAALFLAADYAMAYSVRGTTYGMQGRYFFGTLGPFMLLLVIGACGLLGERAWVLRTAPLLIVVLHIASVMAMLHAFYGFSVG